ncbi:MAG: cytochrome c biogenesis CcdA family protein [Candidatus Dormibacteria bacterium]
MQPSFLLAFLAGLASILSPCVFPLMPVYAAYLGGRAGAAPTPTTPALEPDQEPVGRRPRVAAPVFGNGVAFVAGFSAVFVLLFYLLSALEVTLFVRHRREVNFVAGAIIVVFALQTLGVLRLGFLMRERRLHSRPAMGLAGSFVLGITFAAGWTPCIGPQLAAILQVAVNGGFGGFPFMVTYCLGLAVPFLVVATLADRLQGTLRAINRHLGAINLMAGFLLLVFGFLLMSNRITFLNRYAIQSPFDL